MKTVYRVTGYDMTTYEDSYEKGEVGPGRLVLSEHGGKAYDSLQALFDDMCQSQCLPKDKSAWCMVDNGRLDCQFQVDENNYLVTEEQNPRLFQDWRQGKCKLWTAYFCIYIVKSQEEALQDSEALEFGIALA